jgi:glycosyltransferase involved in cell wall biosynthesis
MCGGGGGCMKIIFHTNLEGAEGPGFVHGQIRRAIEEAGLELEYTYFPITNYAEFDIEATKAVEKCDLFIGGLMGYHSQIMKAKKLGAKTLLMRFSTHHLHQQRVLQEIYAQNGMKVFPNGLYKTLKEYQLADYFLVLSEYCKYTYVLNGVSPEQVFVVSSGVNLDMFSFAEPCSNPFRVLFVATNAIRKGLPYLLKAWGELVDEGIKGELVICPGIFQHPIKNVVSIPQWLSRVEVSDLYRQCSVSILPSLEEGCAGTNLESMACGRPIIATNVSGAEDIIEDYKEGILIPPANVKAIKETILHFYNDRSELARMGKNARETAEEYTWERFRLEIAEIIEGLNIKYV